MKEPQPRPPHATLRTGAPQVRNMVVDLCRKALDEYRQAGYPFGKTMDGMLVWFEYGQMTTDN